MLSLQMQPLWGYLCIILQHMEYIRGLVIDDSYPKKFQIRDNKDKGQSSTGKPVQMEQRWLFKSPQLWTALLPRRRVKNQQWNCSMLHRAPESLKVMKNADFSLCCFVSFGC